MPGNTVIRTPNGGQQKICHGGFKLICHADGSMILYPVSSDESEPEPSRHDKVAAHRLKRTLRLGGRRIGSRRGGQTFFSVGGRRAMDAYSDDDCIKRNGDGTIDWLSTLDNGVVRSTLKDLMEEWRDPLGLLDLGSDIPPAKIEIPPEWQQFVKPVLTIIKTRTIADVREELNKNFNHRSLSTVMDPEIYMLCGFANRYEARRNYEVDDKTKQVWIDKQVLFVKERIKTSQATLAAWTGAITTCGPRFMREFSERIANYHTGSQGSVFKEVRVEFRIHG